MVTTDVELQLRRQLKEAGRLLANPPAAIDELLHILDQSEKLLSMVDQTPNNIMLEALSPLMKALYNGSFLEHSNMDVKVSIASCLCEIIRITAPEPPYSDEEMKLIFQCVVSSLENLSDKSSRSYPKRVSILETVSKVRASVIMLDLECDDLIVKMFEYFVNSVRDHHVGNAYSLMVNIMTLVLEESEEISLALLKPLLASVKNDSEGVLPVARKLGEDVIKKSADILRPYLRRAVAFLGDSLVDYSKVLTSICEGKTDFDKHNDENASVQRKVVDTAPTIVDTAPTIVDTAPTIVSLNDTAKVINNKETATTNENEDVDDHPDSNSNLTSKLDTNNSAAVNSENVESSMDKTTKSAELVVSETVHGENRAVEKSPEIAVSVQKPLQSEAVDAPSESGSQQKEPQFKIQITKKPRSKKKGSIQTDQPSTVDVSTKVNEVLSDPEMRSPKRARKKSLKAAESTPSVITGSDVEAQKSKKVEAGDSGPKQAKRSRKKVGDGGSTAKKPKLSGKKVSELKKSKQDDTEVAEAGDSDVKSAKESVQKSKETDSDAKPVKQSGKMGQKSKVITKPSEDKVITKPSEDDANKDEETESDDIPLKSSGKKEQKSKAQSKLSEDNAEEIDSDATPLKQSAKKGQKSKVITKLSEDNANKDEKIDSDATALKQSAKKAKKSKVITKLSEDNANKDENTDLNAKPLKQSGKKGKKTKPSEEKINKDAEADSDAIPLKQTVKKGQKRKPSEDNTDKGEETDSDVTPLKESVKKLQKSKVTTKPSEDKSDKDEETDSDVTPLKQSVKKVQKSKVTTKPSEDNANKDEEADSGDKQVKPSENKEEENDADNKPLNSSEKKDEEETDSDNIPLMQSAKRASKSVSSVVKSSSKNKEVKKSGGGKNIKEKAQTKPVSEDDDGMDVSLKSALKKATKGKGNSEEALSTGSKRKRSNTKTKVTKAIKYDESLVGKKVKVWWPHDKMYYEGLIEAYDAAQKMHTIGYLDGDEETLILKKEKWELLEEFSSPNQEVAADVQNTDVLPEAAGSSEGEGKVKPKEVVESKEVEETKKDAKKEKPKKIVYSRGKKVSKSNAKPSDDNVKEAADGDAAEEPESEKEKSTETPKTGSKTGNKKKKLN